MERCKVLLEPNTLWLGGCDPKAEPDAAPVTVGVVVEPKADTVGAGTADVVVEPKVGSAAAEDCNAESEPNAEAMTGALLEPKYGSSAAGTVDVVVEPKRDGLGAGAADVVEEPKRDGLGASVVDVAVEPKRDGLGAAIVDAEMLPNPELVIAGVCNAGTEPNAVLLELAAGVWPCLLDSVVVDWPFLLGDPNTVAGSDFAAVLPSPPFRLVSPFNATLGKIPFDDAGVSCSCLTVLAACTGGSLTRIFFFGASVLGANSIKLSGNSSQFH